MGMPGFEGCERQPGWPLPGGLAALGVALLLAAGCATRAADPAGPATVEPMPRESGAGSDTPVKVDPDVVSYDEYRDPLMPVNRVVFGFNDIVSTYALVPLGKAYTFIVPDPVEYRVDDFFYNVRGPIYAVNHLLQGKPADSGHNLLRFGVNGTIGLLGLFDPAESWFGLDRRDTGFAETLSHYDAGYGVYVVLPFLGPSDVRNAGGRVVDYFLHPVPYLLDDPEAPATLAFGYFHEFAQNAGEYEKLREESEDPYIFIRNLHLQKIQRDAAYR